MKPLFQVENLEVQLKGRKGLPFLWRLGNAWAFWGNPAAASP